MLLLSQVNVLAQLLEAVEAASLVNTVAYIYICTNAWRDKHACMLTSIPSVFL